MAQLPARQRLIRVGIGRAAGAQERVEHHARRVRSHHHGVVPGEGDVRELDGGGGLGFVGRLDDQAAAAQRGDELVYFGDSTRAVVVALGRQRGDQIVHVRPQRRRESGLHAVIRVGPTDVQGVKSGPTRVGVEHLRSYAPAAVSVPLGNVGERAIGHVLRQGDRRACREITDAVLFGVPQHPAEEPAGLLVGPSPEWAAEERAVAVRGPKRDVGPETNACHARSPPRARHYSLAPVQVPGRIVAGAPGSGETQEPGPRLLDHALLRVAAWPVETLERFTAPELAEAASQLAAMTAEIERRSASLIDALHETVPAVPDREVRAYLLATKRSIHAGTAVLPLPTAAMSARLEAVAPPLAGALLQETEARRGARGGAHAFRAALRRRARSAAPGAPPGDRRPSLPSQRSRSATRCSRCGGNPFARPRRRAGRGFGDWRRASFTR